MDGRLPVAGSLSLRLCHASDVAGGGAHNGVGDLVDRRFPSSRDRSPVDRGAWPAGVGTLILGTPAQDDVAGEQALVLPALSLGHQRIHLGRRRHIVVQRGRQCGLSESCLTSLPGRLFVEDPQTLLIVTDPIRARGL